MGTFHLHQRGGWFCVDSAILTGCWRITAQFGDWGLSGGGEDHHAYEDTSSSGQSCGRSSGAEIGKNEPHPRAQSRPLGVTAWREAFVESAARKWLRLNSWDSPWFPSLLLFLPSHFLPIKFFSKILSGQVVVFVLWWHGRGPWSWEHLSTCCRCAETLLGWHLLSWQVIGCLTAVLDQIQ